ncbi:hypothetical protein C5167_025385 [Papaver somniferum]|uniref:Uncharacterized protein n=1 Tax=Papaver somniferum TaxID=3469 RepID=A0A4Y7JSD3_PAPSO|nr:hypothetical protein C5167_025385 [Papaver somniferum]
MEGNAKDKFRLGMHPYFKPSSNGDELQGDVPKNLIWKFNALLRVGDVYLVEQKSRKSFETDYQDNEEIEGKSRHNQQLYLSIYLAYQTALQRLCNAGAPVYLGDKIFVSLTIDMVSRVRRLSSQEIVNNGRAPHKQNQISSWEHIFLFN